MTTQDVIAHWRKGAKDALEAATLLAKDGKHELALFHCHLAAEKALILLVRGYPVHRVVVFGSVARDEATADSDLDSAIVGRPFVASRQEENIALGQLCWDVDIRIEPLTLHPDDFWTLDFALSQEWSGRGPRCRRCYTRVLIRRQVLLESYQLEHEVWHSDRLPFSALRPLRPSRPDLRLQ